MRALAVLLCSVICTEALAWDPIGDIKNPGRILRNIQRETGAAIDKVPVVGPAINDAGRTIDRWRLELQSSVFTGPGLEQWFYASRNTSINGAQPIPPNIRAAVQGWYDDDVLNRARFKVGDGGALNLANNSIRVGSAEAVTLIDVIVFKGPTEASQPDLWVHELKHVQQFRDWGVRDFAIRYMRSWNSVENEAYAIQGEYQRNPGPRGQTAFQQPPNFPMLSQMCATPAGMCIVPQPQQKGVQCGCQFPNGLFMGFLQ
ncbi:eCIS core domain-containing protein [Methylobacterium sp. Gmos1]